MPERLFLQLEDDPAEAEPPGAAGSSFHELRPSSPLAAVVSSIGVCHERFADGVVMEERVLPDGAVRLLFNLGEPPSPQGAQGGPAEVSGATCAAALIRLSGNVDGLVVTLRPGAAAALLGLPAGEAAGQTLSLRELWGDTAEQVLEKLTLAGSDLDRVAIVEDTLLRRLRTNHEPVHRGVAQAAALIVASGGRRPLREVAEHIGVGERRLQQLFHQHVGMSPKAWCRLARFRACLRTLRQRSAPDWAELALQAGYFDQSHLVQEFRAFCGLTPTGLWACGISGSSKTAD